MAVATFSDYDLLLGKLSLDMEFAKEFIADPKAILAKYSLAPEEESKLMNLDFERFENAINHTQVNSSDCDSCCNGGQPDGDCSECFAACCQ
ncbi:hypothetical protein [Fuchsiella alkaliacetigena]|uniref:hypothetical protein n=1 Tax=Fuchsiella alkaliacetigena TaxID=957042 RepID=UPI00200B8AEC|nr:hypothetical protein [Fuchsiella alkaliacetigena]MCK8824025.1 hypothetical protein [Fuchsiella alkaliacetigena]